MYYKNRYYDTETGRFINRDPLGVQDGLALFEFASGGRPYLPRRLTLVSQYRDGMNAYEYVKTRPVNFGDKFGLNMGGPLNITIPKTKPKCGICGPDVTQALNAVRNKIIGDFKKLSVKDQTAKCTGLWGGASWDITQLHDSGFLPNKGCSTGDCAGTVQVNGKCYSSDAVNYYMYGTMHSLCSLLPEKTVKIGMLWPFAVSGDASCKSKWAWAGIWGGTSGVSCSDYSFCERCPNKFGGPFNYDWNPIKLWPFY